ncbi:solute carrier family 25 member 53 [Esox lucius]|uniref:Solute carrier family 25 member 53 n=1 Tax=Esox lucius TaxID=8010 RepID=A0AAY5KBR6_ESOLU|nr:solute carrier family 25 member 53 [Esox lucius]XP_019901414.1 solute carrier family 25 member 53 [Esox lucius]
MMGRGFEHNKDMKGLKEDRIFLLSNFLYGGTAFLVPTILTFPVYKTVFRQQLHSSLVRQAIGQLRKEGFLKLYRGVAPPLLIRTLNGTLLFGLHGSFLHLLSRSSTNIPLSVLPAVAGLGTGVVEAIVFTPFERVQNILQNGGNDRSLPNMKSVLARLWAERLRIGFYRAFIPILTRNALGSCIYFSLKDPMSAALGEMGLPPVASSFLSGMVNSIVISLPLYPLSVLTANMQAAVEGDAARVGVRGSWTLLWEGRVKRSVTLLYRGGSLVILRSCISWGFITAIYDQLRKRPVY